MGYRGFVGVYLGLILIQTKTWDVPMDVEPETPLI
jgi:hypothetical protein